MSTSAIKVRKVLQILSAKPCKWAKRIPAAGPQSLISMSRYSESVP